MENKGLPVIEGIDNDIAISKLATAALAIDIIKRFSVGAAADVDALRSFRDKLVQQPNDAEALKGYEIKAHSMKSTSATIGAMAVSEKAKSMEYAAKDSNIDLILAETDKLVEMYLNQAENIKAAFREETTGGVQYDKDNLVKQLKMLNIYIADMDIDEADNIMNEIKECNYPADIAGQIEMLESYVTIIDVDNVAMQVAAIMKML